MSMQLRREMEEVKQRLLSLCGLAEDQVRLAVRAFIDRDPELARRVEQRDAEIDLREVEMEENCLKVLALYQPVAVDLRQIVSAIKINNDLERIGDLAVNVAHKASAIAALPPREIPFDLEAMSDKTQAMLRRSVDALVNMDPKGATAVCASDDEIDGMKHELRLKVQELIRGNPSEFEFLLNLLAVSRNLERIADLASNVAEDVIYMVEGQIVRHGAGQRSPSSSASS